MSAVEYEFRCKKHGSVSVAYSPTTGYGYCRVCRRQYKARWRAEHRAQARSESRTWRQRRRTYRQGDSLASYVEYVERLFAARDGAALDAEVEAMFDDRGSICARSMTDSVRVLDECSPWALRGAALLLEQIEKRDKTLPYAPVPEGARGV